jgi:hypothetical protein
MSVAIITQKIVDIHNRSRLINQTLHGKEINIKMMKKNNGGKNNTGKNN